MDVDDPAVPDPDDVDREAHALHPEAVDGGVFVGEVHACAPGEGVSLAEAELLLVRRIGELHRYTLACNFNPGFWRVRREGCRAAGDRESERHGE